MAPALVARVGLGSTKSKRGRLMYIISFIAKLWRVLNTGFLSVMLWAVGLNVFFGVAFYFAERNAQDITFIDALWWSMVTMTTVGYGDFYAQTWVGRFLVSYPCMLIGIGIIGYLVGLVANFMLELASKKRKGEMDIVFKNHVILCNYPGEEKVVTVVEELRAARHFGDLKFVLVTEVLEELPPKLAKMKLSFVKGYPTDEETLKRANVFESAGVIILAEDPASLRSDDRSYAVGSIVESLEKESGQSIKTIVELVGVRNVRNLERAEIDGMVAEERLAGCLLAQEFINPGVNRVISQLLTNVEGSQLYILEEKAMAGCSLRSLQKGVLEHDVNMQIIGLIRGTEQILNPPKQTELRLGDKLIVLAERARDLAIIEKEIAPECRPVAS